MASEQPGQLVAVKLPNVELVTRLARVGVFGSIWRRQDHEAFGFEHAVEFFKHSNLGFAIDVLDRLERHDQIERSIRERQRRAGRLDEAEVGAGRILA